MICCPVEAPVCCGNRRSAGPVFGYDHFALGDGALGVDFFLGFFVDVDHVGLRVTLHGLVNDRRVGRVEGAVPVVARAGTGPPIATVVPVAVPPGSPAIGRPAPKPAPSPTPAATAPVAVAVVAWLVVVARATAAAPCSCANGVRCDRPFIVGSSCGDTLRILRREGCTCLLGSLCIPLGQSGASRIGSVLIAGCD